MLKYVFFGCMVVFRFVASVWLDCVLMFTLYVLVVLSKGLNIFCLGIGWWCNIVVVGYVCKICFVVLMLVNNIIFLIIWFVLRVTYMFTSSGSFDCWFILNCILGEVNVSVLFVMCCLCSCFVILWSCFKLSVKLLFKDVLLIRVCVCSYVNVVAFLMTFFVNRGLMVLFGSIVDFCMI